MNYTIVNGIKCHAHTYIYSGVSDKFSVRLQKWCMIPISHTNEIFCFSATKCAFGVNPRDADHRVLKLATEGDRITIASGIRLYKHAYY